MVVLCVLTSVVCTLRVLVVLRPRMRPLVSLSEETFDFCSVSDVNSRLLWCSVFLRAKPCWLFDVEWEAMVLALDKLVWSPLEVNILAACCRAAMATGMSSSSDECIVRRRKGFSVVRHCHLFIEVLTFSTAVGPKFWSCLNTVDIWQATNVFALTLTLVPTFDHVNPSTTALLLVLKPFESFLYNCCFLLIQPSFTPTGSMPLINR